jgi:two-component system response regulator FixJ
MAAAGRHIIGIVDDDEAVRQSLRFLLDVAGHDVVDYPSAAAFLEGCDLTEVLGLILDQHMPRMSGLDLVIRIRSAGQTFPILMITGFPSAELAAQAAALGVARVLEKPPPEEQLMAFVEGLRA